MSPLTKTALVLATGTVLAGAAAADRPAPLTCRFETLGQAPITLAASVEAARKVEGTYVFALTQSGGGSDIRLRQEGAFSALPGTPVRLGEATILAGGRLQAELTLSYEGRSLTCRTPGPIDL
ncbi:hypothetical protein DXV76_07275 [Rhodobacteraceae bacterium CCMM004]|nr:hypothetical protein DXV76_07275 [Rhodobacteraceae bacterium CCMM004]